MTSARGRTADKQVKDKSDNGETTAAAPPQGPARYYNRELSWLQFNRRVLEEARVTTYPLLERLRFLAISANNLDEFYMVRAAGIVGQITAGVSTVSQDGLTPAQQLTAINRFVSGLVYDKQEIWTGLIADLAKAGVHLLDERSLTPAQRGWLERLFMSHIFPILTPIAVDPAHPFPFIPNLGLTLAVEMRGTTRKMNGLIPIPNQLERFIRLPDDSEDPQTVRFVQIETLIGMFLSALFPGFEVTGRGAFRLIRDSDIEIQEEAEDLVRSFETLLKRRRRGHVIRLEIDSGDAGAAQQVRGRGTRGRRRVDLRQGRHPRPRQRHAVDRRRSPGLAVQALQHSFS